MIRTCRQRAHFAIVSLNWDCLIDQALVPGGRPDPTCLDYGTAVCGSDGKPLEPQPGAPLLLKPHGSLGWGFCPLCHRVVVDLETPFHFFHERPCPGEHRPVLLRPVLVPPAPYATPRPPMLHEAPRARRRRRSPVDSGAPARRNESRGTPRAQAPTAHAGGRGSAAARAH